MQLDARDEQRGDATAITAGNIELMCVMCVLACYLILNLVSFSSRPSETLVLGRPAPAPCRHRLSASKAQWQTAAHAVTRRFMLLGLSHRQVGGGWMRSVRAQHVQVQPSASATASKRLPRATSDCHAFPVPLRGEQLGGFRADPLRAPWVRMP